MFTSYSAFDKDNSLPFNLSKDEFESLCKMENVNNLIIQKTGKDNTIVILDKDSYFKINRNTYERFSKIQEPDKDLNHVINPKKSVTDLLKKT